MPHIIPNPAVDGSNSIRFGAGRPDLYLAELLSHRAGLQAAEGYQDFD